MITYKDYLNEATTPKEETMYFSFGDDVHYVNKEDDKIHLELFGKITQTHMRNNQMTYRIRFYEQREINVSGNELHKINPQSDKLYELIPEKVKDELDYYNFRIGDSVIVSSSMPGKEAFYGLSAKIESLHPYSNIKGAYQYTIRFDDFKGRMRISEWELSVDDSKKDDKNMSEINFKFNINDPVRFIDKNKSYPECDKCIGRVKFRFTGEDGNEYTIELSTGKNILALEDELESVSEDIAKNGQHVNKNTVNFSQYVQGQSGKPKGEIKVGSKILIDGRDDQIVYDKAIGIVKKITSDEYFVEIQDNDSKNTTSYHANIPMKLATLIERNKDRFEEGDMVVCIDQSDPYYKKTGQIIRRWEQDNSYMVQFVDDEVWMEFKNLKYPEDAPLQVGTEKKKIGFDIPKPTTNQKRNIIEEEEDEEEPVTKKRDRGKSFKKEDLLEFSYEDFFTDNLKITKLEDVKALKTKFQSMMGESNSEIKKIFAEKAFHSIEIIESYFEFLTNKIAKDLPVLRINDIVEDTDLLYTKTKVRASDNKEIVDKYTLDQGIVAYWKFKDAIVFKTL